MTLLCTQKMRIAFTIYKGADPNPEAGGTFDPVATLVVEDKEFVGDDTDRLEYKKRGGNSVQELLGEDVFGRIIVRQEDVAGAVAAANCFRVFDSVAELRAFMVAAPRVLTLHDVCLPGVPRKLALAPSTSRRCFSRRAFSLVAV